MPYFSWVAQEDALTNGVLTVRAQTISPNDQGRLLWDAFFPRKNADSIKLREIAQLDYRPASDRREWNARGRLIALRTPNIAEIEMIPIEAFFKIGEREMQDLFERTMGNEDLFRNVVRPMIPERVDDLASANYRRVEVDAMTAWALGNVTVRNPVTNATGTVSFGFSAARYEVAGTAWNVVANAYTAFMAWLGRAVDLVGPITGVVLRQATFNEILLDAPNPFSNVAGIPPTRNQLEQRIQDELGSDFSFFVNENSVDVFTTGGLDVTRAKVWPAQIVAAVPAGEQVGSTYFAPVVRAFEISRAEPDAEIDVRGQTAFLEAENGGRQLTAEVQVNALTVPTEAKVATINAGV